MQWDEVPKEKRNGEIQGYKVLCSDAGEPKPIPVDASKKETLLTDLRWSTVYTIEVLAFTGAGDGQVSSGVSVPAGEDSSVM